MMRMAGLVLAGGRSRRFGAEKAVQSLGGRPLLLWSLAALAPACASVVVSARPGSDAEALARARGHQVVLDDPAHAAGPLAGIAAGLAWAADVGFEALATLPCDTPLVGADHIEAIIAALGDGPAAYAVTGDGPQALCAVWRTELGGDLARRLERGDHPPVHRFLAEVGARAVSFAKLGPFRNVNAPEDLAALEAELAA